MRIECLPNFSLVIRDIVLAPCNNGHQVEKVDLLQVFLSLIFTLMKARDMRKKDITVSKCYILIKKDKRITAIILFI